MSVATMLARLRRVRLATEPDGAQAIVLAIQRLDLARAALPVPGSPFDPHVSAALDVLDGAKRELAEILDRSLNARGES
jgi:hypothetical protein